MHQSYETFLRRLTLINGEETNENFHMVKCPENNEVITLSYCQNARGKDKPCEMYENKECLERYPENE